MGKKITRSISLSDVMDERNPFHPQKFQLIEQGNQAIIRDVENYENIFFVATTGFGTKTPTLKLARKVVDFLNAETQTEQRHAT